MSWFNNPWQAANPWAEGKPEFEKAVGSVANTDQRNAKEAQKVKRGLQIKIKDGSAVIFYDRELYTQDGLYEKGQIDVEALVYTEGDAFGLAVKANLNLLWSSATAQVIIQTLQRSTEENPFLIVETEDVGEQGSRSIATMCYWNYKNPEKLPTENGEIADAATNLIHELGHAYRWKIGLNQKDESSVVDSFTGFRKEEEETAHLENRVRIQTNRPLRTKYSFNLIVKNKKRIFGNWNYATQK